MSTILWKRPPLLRPRALPIRPNRRACFCFQEHGRPTGDDLFPVRESRRRQGLSDGYVLVAAHSQDPNGKIGAADHEPLMKLIAWARRLTRHSAAHLRL